MFYVHLFFNHIRANRWHFYTKLYYTLQRDIVCCSSSFIHVQYSLLVIPTLFASWVYNLVKGSVFLSCVSITGVCHMYSLSLPLSCKVVKSLHLAISWSWHVLGSRKSKADWRDLTFLEWIHSQIQVFLSHDWMF